MVAAAYRRSDFLSRLLLLAAHAAQGSTSCDTDGVANMTKDSFFDDGSDREKRRDRVSNFVIDSGATIHCINDISLFNEIYDDHPGIGLKVANGEPMHSHAVGNVKLKLERADGTYSEILIHNVVYHPSFSHK